MRTPRVTDADERVILVDDEDRMTGTAEKLVAHRSGALHRAFSVMVWDSAGRLLLQKRHAGKYHSGGLWTNACCGHPRPDEDIAEAASRRLEEEMGFASPLTALGTIRYRAELDHGMIEHELVHVFRGIHDGTIAPNSIEADGYQWCSPNAVRADIAATPQRFTVWFRHYVAAEWPVAAALPEPASSQSQG